MFWNRKKRLYPLPKFPDSIRPTFKRLCGLLTEQELLELRSMVHENEARIIAEAATNNNIDKGGVSQIAKACSFLLDQYLDQPADKQKLIAGAVRYFVAGDDPFDDTVFASGLDDDLRIVNHVLEDLGFVDRCVVEH